MQNTDQSDNIGEIFESGQSGLQVVRVGETIRKKLKPNYEFAHEVLKVLEENDFGFAPRLLGLDDQNREILTYLDGEILNNQTVTLDLAIQAIAILRDFHDIFSTSEVRGDQETVCHSDFAPWNLIQKDGKVVGMIDFDDVKKGRRINDLAYACWTFLDLGITGNEKSDAVQIDEIIILIQTYGDIDTRGFVETLLNEQHNVLAFRKSRVENATDDAARVEDSRKVLEIEHSIDWVERHRVEIEKKLRN